MLVTPRRAVTISACIVGNDNRISKYRMRAWSRHRGPFYRGRLFVAHKMAADMINVSARCIIVILIL